MGARYHQVVSGPGKTCGHNDTVINNNQFIFACGLVPGGGEGCEQPH